MADDGVNANYQITERLVDQEQRAAKSQHAS